MEPNQRFPDSRIFCRLDIAVRSMLQAAPPFECPQTEAGIYTRDDLAGRRRLLAYEIARFWLQKNFANKTVGADANRAGGKAIPGVQ